MALILALLSMMEVAGFSLWFTILNQQAVMCLGDLVGQGLRKIGHHPFSRAMRCAASRSVSIFLG